jgi:flagellar basal-body rod protein FlgG
MSNVDLAGELTNMIVAQRAYSLNVKVAQSTDEMMSLINQFSI